MRPLRLRPLFGLVVLFAFTLVARAVVPDGEVFLFTYFTGNGEDGLHLAWSEDGYHWRELGNGRSFLAPQIGKDKLMRDPCVTRGPDGVYHLVWTSGWWDRIIGHASTKDFLTWSDEQAVPVMMHEPTARNAWAPEVAWDAARAEYVIFWASTIPGRFPETAGASEDELNHRIYATTTSDWRSFTPTRLFCDPGFSVIDATLLPRAGGKFSLIVKDETKNPPKKHLRLATADGIAGPWRDFAPPFTRDWVEGPTAIQVGDETLVYFDVYREHHYGAVRSRDLKTWEDVTDQISLPRGVRHGTMIAVPRALIDSIRAAHPDVEHLVRFDAPATHFTESTPLGNGRLGLMPFGGVEEERIVLNEAGVWSGSRHDADRPNAAAVLPELRRLLLAGKNAEAEKLYADNFTCAGPGSGWGNGATVPYGTYQVLGDLRLTFKYAEAAPPAAAEPRPAGSSVVRYERELDLANATARTSYERGGVRYEREAFVSAFDETGVLRLTASAPGAISFELKLDRPERASTENVEGNTLRMTGQLTDGQGGGGVKFAAAVRAIARGGKIENTGGVLRVTGADEVLLLVAGATDIKSFAGRKVDDAAGQVMADLAWTQAKSFAALRMAHVAQYRALFDRFALHLGGEAPAAANALDRKTTTQARLVAAAAGANDPGLAQLYFDFGRYLLISSTRPDGFPPNLQGIWADGVTTPWNGDWHLNVNVQMNFWPAEVCNLSELHEALFKFIGSLQEPGAQTARKYYGARGWVAHVLANPWGFTAPGEGADWGATTTGSAWLATHLWEHFLFTGDLEFLRRAYPLLQGSALFYLDMLVEEPTHRWLVTAPANSPENGFKLPDGKTAHLCVGPTFDNQLLRNLFAATRLAARTLGVDGALQQELAAKAERLPPTRIAPDGRVMEWLENYPEEDPHHRHVSHLWGLFPGHEITRRGTPELAAAARLSLDARGDGGTGWCLAHKAAMWARLGDGERALDVLRSLLKPARDQTRIGSDGGGTYPSLLDACPPFQIDGNFGGTAAIAEMLVQSGDGEITLLPALPKAWPDGDLRGLRTRGGFEISLRWRAGVLVHAAVRSLRGNAVVVRYATHVAELKTLAAGQTAEFDGNLAQK